MEIELIDFDICTIRANVMYSKVKKANKISGIRHDEYGSCFSLLVY